MRKAIILLMVMAIACTAVAADPDTSAKGPEKDTVIYPYDPPQVVLQGGDTILNATVIPGIPYSNAGTTDGYIDDYDEVCPYSGSTSPDVVYTFVAGSTTGIDIDLLGSAYDTKVYIYDEYLSLVGCNDDFHPDYTSKLEEVPVLAGVQYFIVVDGYNGASGNYVLTVTESIIEPPCFVICDPDALTEDESPLYYNYADDWNGGCNSPEFGNPFQNIPNQAHTVDGELWWCGVSGYYTTDAGNFRDTDWYIAIMGDGGVMEITLESDLPCYLFELGPQDCGPPAPTVIQNVIADCGEPGTMVVFGPPGSPVWLWVGPPDFIDPDGADLREFNYSMTINGHAWTPPVPNEELSWGGVKALYR